MQRYKRLQVKRHTYVPCAARHGVSLSVFVDTVGSIEDSNFQICLPYLPCKAGINGGEASRGCAAVGG